MGLNRPLKIGSPSFLMLFLLLVFLILKADHSLFTKVTGNSSTYVLVYVDDILVTENNLKDITSLKAFLETKFHIKDLGPLKYFLGIEIAPSKRGFFLCQRKYTMDILHDTGMFGACTAAFPMEQHLKLNPEDGDILPNPSP